MDSSGGGPTRVLLVDPTGDLQDRLGDALADAGFAVSRVENATACIRAIEDGAHDAVLSDDTLPNFDGLRLLRSVRLTHPALPFILVPSGDRSVSRDAARAAAASGYIRPDAPTDTAVSAVQDSLDQDTQSLEREGELRYRHLVEISPAPINLFDATGDSIWGNDAVIDLLGLDDRADLIGRSIFEFIHPDDHELARAEIGDVIERKQSVGPTSMRLKRPDGEVRHIQVSTAVGRFLGADIGQAVVVDVTDLRAAQQALQAERDFFEASLDTLQDIFYVIDLDGNLLRWNDAAAEVVGFSDEELETMGIDAFFAEADARRVAASLRRTIVAGSDAVEVSLQTKDGRSIPYEFRGRLLVDSAGEPRIVGIGRDISQRKERDRQLKLLDQWLRHNIRNDINVIQGIASNITEYGAGDVEENARTIQSHASDLIQQADRERDVVDLLTNPPERRVVDLGALVESAASDVANQYPSARIQIERFDDVEAFTIPAIGDVVVELLENAIEHNDTEEPNVSVAVIDEGGSVVIRLTDDGPGIPRSETEVLLEDREIDQLHHTTGMGLLYASTVLRVSHGSIAIEDNEPRGSIVTITLGTA